jgi:hypothetical protein
VGGGVGVREVSKTETHKIHGFHFPSTHVKTSGSFANTAGPGKRLQISTASSDLDRALGRVRCSVSCPAFPGPVRVGLFPGVV